MNRRRFLIGTFHLAAGTALAACAPGGTPLSTPTESPAGPGATPAPGPGEPLPAGYMTFVVNVHDWTHGGESAAALERLLDIFSAYGVRADFYFTPEITRVLAAQSPALIERFRRGEATISYHVRPPHPLNSGFDAVLNGLDDAALAATLRDYETFALNLETGALDRSQAGGYRYVAEVFGTNPVTASVPHPNARIKSAGRAVLRELGAQVTVLDHEGGNATANPYRWADGLLARPVDFSVTRVTPVDGSDQFWWNVIARSGGEKYDPVGLAEMQLEAWQQAGRDRPPFILAHVHENNLYRRGAEGWSSIYFEIVNGERGNPLPPPWDLDAPDPSRPRPQAEQEAIWAAYERLVAWASRTVKVITSADVPALASAAGVEP